MNQIIQPKEESSHGTPSNPSCLCCVCGADHLVPFAWRRCGECEDLMESSGDVVANDAPIETFEAWTRKEVWASPRAGRA